MADGSQPLHLEVVRTPARVLGREQEFSRQLPYARHVTDTVLALDTGALMISFRLDGLSFETADTSDINGWHARLNNAWRNLADDRLAVWTHVVRRLDTGYPGGAFRSAFARRLDQAYRARISRSQLYVNELYVSLVLHPGRGVGEGASALLARLRRARTSGVEVEAAAVERLQEKGRDLEQYLARYGAQPLGLFDRDGLVFSEPMALLQLLLTGRPQPMPLVRGHIGRAIYGSRVIFGRESLEIREPGEQRFGGMFGVKAYPASTTPGLWDGLLKARYPFVATQSFTFLSKVAARAVMERRQNQMVRVGDRAASQIDGLDEALDDLVSNRFVMGDHQFSLLVYGETPRQLQAHMSLARATLAESGMLVAREDLALEGAFWSQFPGNFAFRTRPAAITSRNFAALAPFHTFPAGRRDGNHWGPAVALLRTSAMSPFSFNFHVSDIGHAFICGPTGSGKTVVQNFMLAQLEKLGAQQIFVDKDRGAEIFVRACGGTYLALKNAAATGFAPLKALELTPGALHFLGRLVRQLVTPADRPLTVQEERRIDEALAALLPLPPEDRSLLAVRQLLGRRDPEGIGARLDKWCRGGALGWVLDNDRDELSLEPRLLGLDMTDFLDNPEVRTPIMMYLFHRIDLLADGRRLVVDIDEFWKALGDEAFRALAQDGLKTYRKRNAMMVFGTQSPSDVLKSAIAPAIVEMCATKIYMPNPYGTAKDYIEGFGLTAEEFRLIHEELSPESRQFLIKQGHNSVVVELDLGGLDDELAVLSGRSETVELLDRIRARHGDDPRVWEPIFHQERRRL